MLESKLSSQMKTERKTLLYSTNNTNQKTKKVYPKRRKTEGGKAQKKAPSGRPSEATKEVQVAQINLQ